MTTTDTPTARNLTDDQCEQVAEWLVRSNGEGCDQLQDYGIELEAGLDVVLDLARPDIATPADLQRITRLVSTATVTVRMPALDA